MPHRLSLAGPALHFSTADIHPAWLYLDARTLLKQFGEARLRYFQPLKTIFEKGGIAGGGSDHMQKVGSLRSINPYNPFRGLATTLTRRARWFDGQLHPEEALSREQALRFYTSNNAHILFLDDAGSLTPGQLADFILLDHNLLTCPLDDLKDTQVLITFLGGKWFTSASKFAALVGWDSVPNLPLKPAIALATACFLSPARDLYQLAARGRDRVPAYFFVLTPPPVV